MDSERCGQGMAVSLSAAAIQAGSIRPCRQDFDAEGGPLRSLPRLDLWLWKALVAQALQSAIDFEAEHNPPELSLMPACPHTRIWCKASPL